MNRFYLIITIVPDILIDFMYNRDVYIYENVSAMTASEVTVAFMNVNSY